MTEIIERKQLLRASKQAENFVRQRLQEAAENFDEHVNSAMRVELCNEAIAQFLELLYTKDQVGTWVHIDRVTFRILLPKPWGSLGWKYYGLRQWESRVLSKILISRMQNRQSEPLFDYNPEVREWYLNVAAYRSKEAATAYLDAKPITVTEWRKVSTR